jgi:hypothetical protein
LRHLTDVLFALMMYGFVILGIVRPDVIVRWVRQLHPEYAGDEKPLLFIVRLVGWVGLGIVIFFSVIIVRSF